MTLLGERGKKSCMDVLNSGLQLMVWGIQTSRKPLSEIIGDKDPYWKRWVTINDYCLYIITLNENSELTDVEKEYCDKLILLLKEDVRKMRSIYDDSASNDPDCGKILGLERAILTIQEARLGKNRRTE